MTRTTLPIAVALAAAGLLLSGCGGGGSDSSDTIPSSPAATTTTAAAAATTTPTATGSAAGAPTFDLPSDITTDFRGFTSSDPTKQAILTDAKYAATAILEGESQIRTSETPNVKRYFAGAQGAQLADSIIAYGKGGNVATGAYRYYQPVVKDNASAHTVTVSYCEDQRKAYDKNAVTGKVRVTTPSPSDFRSWVLLMARNASGDWQVFHYNWVRGAKQCQVA